MAISLKAVPEGKGLEGKINSSALGAALAVAAALDRLA